MKLLVELPERGVRATMALYSDAAPRVTRLIYESLAQPLETHTAHACFDGHEVYCFLPPFSETPPLENRTMRPRPGEVMFFHAAPNAFAATADDRLSGGSPSVFELAFMYGEVDLRHYWEDGFHGSLVGRIEDGVEAFASACGQTLVEGRTALRISRAED
jgi:Protein of unknown function (DUF3830)